MENILLRSLLVLSLCSVGSALSCFDCDTDNDAICPKKQCPANYDVCINVTLVATKQVIRRCWTDQRCLGRAVHAEFSKGSDVNFVCCNSDLCNSRQSGTAGTDLNPFLLSLLAASIVLHLPWF